MSTGETTADGPASDHLGPRTFLVDDDAGLRARVRELLEEEGITVVGEASTGTAALELVPMAAMVLPLVVLMDVRMPGLVNGIEATRLLVRSGANIRIIVFTGFPDRGIEQAASEAGAIAVLVKGGRAIELIAAVRRAWVGAMVGGRSADRAGTGLPR